MNNYLKLQHCHFLNSSASRGFSTSSPKSSLIVALNKPQSRRKFQSWEERSTKWEIHFCRTLMYSPKHYFQYQNFQNGKMQIFNRMSITFFKNFNRNLRSYVSQQNPLTLLQRFLDFEHRQNAFYNFCCDNVKPSNSFRTMDQCKTS